MKNLKGHGPVSAASHDLRVYDNDVDLVHVTQRMQFVDSG